MNSLYLEPEDLINLIAENQEFKQEQIHFHITYYEGVGKIHKRDEAVLALAACAMLGGKIECCEQLLKTFSESNTSSLSYLYFFLAGLVQEKCEEYQNAIENYFKASQAPHELIKRPAVLKTRILECFLELNSYSQAIEFFSQITEIPSEAEEVFLSRLAYCHEQIRSEKAVEWYKAIKSKESIISQACSVWVMILEGQDILGILEEYIAKSAENKFALCDWKYLLSQYFISKNELDKAALILKEICELVQKNTYFSALGLVFYKKKNFIQSFVCYLRALNLKKTSPENWFNLSLIYNNVNQTDSAKTLNKAKSLDKAGIISEDLNGDVINVKFDFSQFGNPPIAEKKLKKKVQKKQKIEEPEKIAQEVVMPTFVPSVYPMQGMPINVSMTMNLFYENMMRLWNPSLQNRNLFGMNNVFGAFANRMNGVEARRVEVEPELPKKRGRDKDVKEVKRRK